MENKDNESGSEGSVLSSEKNQDSKKKPCEICGSDANENLIVTCIACRDTREHIYCMRKLLQSVPPMWLCEVCRSSSRVITVAATADSRANHEVEDNESVHHQNISSDSSNQLSQEHSSPMVEDASSPVSMDASQVKNQKLPYSDLPSDSESAI